VASLGDAATMAMLGEERGLYGRVRLGGTLGWGIFALLAGKLLEARGVVFLMYVFSAILLVNLFVSLKLSFGHHDEHATQSGGVKTLLQNRRLVIFLASAFLGGLGAFSVAVYLAPYLTDLNASGDQIGFALAVATIPELAVFFFGNALVKRFTARGLFVIALALMGVRSILFGMVDNLTLAIAIQILGGAIFPAMWLAGVAYADEHAPSNLKSTAQGLFGAMSFGFGSAFGGFAGGLLLDRMGTRGMFLVFGIIIIAGLALTEGLRRILPDEAPLRA
jgi:PPP family 3-phenylpropionic acid transporter